MRRPRRGAARRARVRGTIDLILTDEGLHFLPKPFTRQDLAVKLRDVLGAPPAL